MESDLLSMQRNVCVLGRWSFLLVPYLVTKKELEGGW